MAFINRLLLLEVITELPVARGHSGAMRVITTAVDAEHAARIPWVLLGRLRVPTMLCLVLGRSQNSLQLGAVGGAYHVI